MKGYVWIIIAVLALPIVLADQSISLSSTSYRHDENLFPVVIDNVTTTGNITIQLRSTTDTTGISVQLQRLGTTTTFANPDTPISFSLNTTDDNKNTLRISNGDTITAIYGSSQTTARVYVIANQDTCMLYVPDVYTLNTTMQNLTVSLNQFMLQNSNITGIADKLSQCVKDKTETVMNTDQRQKDLDIKLAQLDSDRLALAQQNTSAAALNITIVQLRGQIDQINLQQQQCDNARAILSSNLTNMTSQNKSLSNQRFIFAIIGVIVGVIAVSQINNMRRPRTVIESELPRR